MRFAPVLLCLLVFVAFAAAQTTQPAGHGGFQPLFNGRDLSGWYTYLKGVGKNTDPQKVFQVHDGMIHIYKDAADGSEMPFGYLCSEKEFGDCRIRFEYKWGTKRFGSRATKRRDSGFLYFVTGEDGKQGTWPTSVECQIQENDVGDIYAIRTTVASTVDPATISEKAPTYKDASAGGVTYVTPGKGNDRIIRSRMLEKEGWNAIEVVLRGDGATHIVNGSVNMQIRQVQFVGADSATIHRGRILFQAEGAEVMYRNIEVQPLADAEQWLCQRWQ